MKNKTIKLCIFSILFFFLLSPVTAYAEENGNESDDITLAPYFFIENADTSVDSFPLKETNVTTTINGTIAETYVVQTYANEGKNPINASYVFPASTKVTIHGMKMQIGNELITAKIKEKEEAKKKYEEAKSEGKSASLLEQKRPNVFTMDVANIMPGDEVSIELHYTELITPTESIYQFVFPTVVGPRYATPSEEGEADTEADQWISSPYLEDGSASSSKYNITVNLSTGVPIADISSKSHEIKTIRNNDTTTAQVTLANPADFAGNRDFILDYRLTGEELSSGLMLQTGEKENFFMLTVQPPERYTPEDIPPREYIFVLDVSGSMNGYPIDTAKDLIKDLVTNLRETDTFNLILFSTSSLQMSRKSVAATEENIQTAIALIDQQDGGGGTSLAPALEKAIAIPSDKNISRSIVVITDGYLSGEREIFNIINNNLDTTNFFSFGIGDSVNRYLIEGIAKAGSGECFVVTDSSDAKETAQRFRTYIQAPILTDIHVKYMGFDAYDVEPAVPTTLFAQKPITLFGKWKGDPTGTIIISGKTGSEYYIQEIDVSDVTPSEINDAIPYLWARTKMERLTDYGFRREDESTKKEITELGLNYSMVTPYTSFIAVVETIRNPEGNSTDVDQPLPLPSHVSSLAIGGYAVGSEPGTIILIALMITMILINFLFHKKREKSTNTRGISKHV